MAKIFIGPAGTGGSSIENFSEIKNLGLDAVEIEFTYGVWMTKEQATKIKESNKKIGLKLSIHAPYFINLNSEDKAKIGASKARILKSCEIGNLLSNGEKIHIVFHAGFYLKDLKETTFNNIKKQILEMQKIIKEKKWNVLLSPETTGKPSQFGDLDEIFRLSKETGCSFCIDFSHLRARYNGKINYFEIIQKLKNEKEIHAHFSGIEYTEKGERRHILTGEKEIKELFSHIKNLKAEITMINESPDPLGDALKMKEILKKL
jgi:deoxyribonuclease-4